MSRPKQNKSIIPPPPLAIAPDVLNEIKEWQKISDWLEEGKRREMELRKKLSAIFFPTPKEGTNRIVADGAEVVLLHKITRTLDVAALGSVMLQLPEELRVLGHLIEYTPDFKLATYRTLNDETKKIFEQALTIKDATPELKIALREAILPATPANAAIKVVALAGKPNVGATIDASQIVARSISNADLAARIAPPVKKKPAVKFPTGTKKPAKKKK